MKAIYQRLIIILGIAIIIAIFAISYRGYIVTLRDVAARYAQSQSQISELSAKGIESFLMELQSELRLIAKYPEVKQIEAEKAQAVMQAYYENVSDKIKAISRIDARGILRLTYPPNPDSIGQDLTYQEHIQELLRTRQPVVSIPFRAVQGYQTIALHQPVFDRYDARGRPLSDAEFLGSVAILINYEQLGREFLVPIKTGKSEQAHVLNPQGVVIVCTPAEDLYGKQFFDVIPAERFPETHRFFQRIVGGEKLVQWVDLPETSRGDRKGKYIVSSTPIVFDHLRWMVVVASPYREVVALAQQSYWSNLLVALFVLAVVVVSAVGLMKINKRLVRSEEQARYLRKLRVHEERYQHIFQNAQDAIFLLQPESGKILSANRVSQEMTGYTLEELQRCRIFDLLQAQEVQKMEHLLAVLDEQEHQQEISGLVFVRKNGSEVPIEINASLGKVAGEPVVLGMVRDVTERKKAEIALRNRYQQLAMLHRVSEALAGTLNLNEVCEAIFQQIRTAIPVEVFCILGHQTETQKMEVLYERHEQPPGTADPLPECMSIVHQSLLSSVVREKTAKVSFRDVSLGKATVGISAMHVPMILGDKTVGVIIALTRAVHAYTKEVVQLMSTIANQAAVAVEKAQLFQQTEHMANTDALTGLYNRHFFTKAFHEAAERTKQNGHQLGMMLIDIYNFKNINDVLGYLKGDEILREVAQLIRQQTGPEAIVGRYGGDEFIVLMSDITAQELDAAIQRIQRAVDLWNEAHPLNGNDLVLQIAAKLAGPAEVDRIMADLDTDLHHEKQTIERRLLTEYIEESKATLQKLTIQTILGFAKALETKDVYYRGHSERVAALAIRMAKRFNFTEEQMQNLVYAARLHDIGKIGIDRAVLNKRTLLSQSEQQLLKQHSVAGETVLREVEFLQEAAKFIRHHHERYDGRTDTIPPGYPDGLKGEQIPLASRIIAVVDAYDALILDRPYKDSDGRTFAVEEMIKNTGTQFDPKLIEVLLDILAEDGEYHPEV